MAPYKVKVLNMLTSFWRHCNVNGLELVLRTNVSETSNYTESHYMCKKYVLTVHVNPFFDWTDSIIWTHEFEFATMNWCNANQV